MYNQFANDEASFEEVDANIKANNRFCFYISKEDCDACSQFNPIFEAVIKETKIFTLRMQVHNEVSKNNNVAKLFEAYPSFDTGEAPSFFVCNGSNIEQIPFSRLTSNTKFKNALREKVSLSEIYYTHDVSFDYNEFAKRMKQEVTVISANLYNPLQLSNYKEALTKIDSTTLIFNNIAALEVSTFKVQPN